MSLMTNRVHEEIENEAHGDGWFDCMQHYKEVFLALHEWTRDTGDWRAIHRLRSAYWNRLELDRFYAEETGQGGG